VLTISARVVRGIASSLVLLALSAPVLIGQTDCGLALANATTSLPANTGTLPPSGDMSLGGGSSYLYVMTQWGWARSSLSNPANPTPYNLTNVGLFQGNGGVIQINCDCEQGWNTGEVAQTPDGTARMVGDWYPYVLDNSDPLSGLPAQVAMTTGTGMPTFGQQINLPAKVPLGGRVTAIAIPGSPNKFFGYFPVSGTSVYVADISAPTGVPSVGGAIQPTVAIGWQTGSGSSPANRLKAAHVSIPAYDKYLLVGSTGTSATGYSVRVAEINTSNGTANEVASSSIDALPSAIEIGVVENRIFIFVSEGSSGGLRIYEYQPPGTLMDAGEIAGDYRRVIVRGPSPFPAIIAHRYQGTSSFIDIFGTKWLTQGGTPQRAMSLPHFGASDASYRGVGYEALVTQSGSQLLAYLYRETTTAPQQSVHTDKLDISCIAADPTSPPIPNVSLTNLTAQAQGRSINYLGDKWQVKDASVSYPVIDQIRWDLNLPSGNAANFSPDAAFTGAYGGLSTIPTAYLPCDPSSGGDPAGGTACWQSAGGPTGGNFYVGVNTHNLNGWGLSPAVSQPQSIAAPQVKILGYDGTNLLILSGGSADASASQGNTAEATFTWNFTCSPSCGQQTGPVVTVPTAATAFSLVTHYKGDYSVTTAGGVQQVDLVPAFSITSQLPALVNSPVTIKNLMQKGGTTSLNFVDFAITSSSAPPGTWTSLVGCTPPAGFCNANGTTTVTAPGNAGTYYLHLRYNFSGPHGGGQSLSPAPIQFATTTFQPNPVLVVCKNNSIPCNSPVSYLGSYGLTTGTTYYLSDGENMGSVPHPGSSYWKSSNQTPSTSGDQSLGTSAGAGPVSYAPASCSSSCYLKIEVPATGGTIHSYPFTAGSGNPPPPPPPPPGASLSVTGPTSGTTGAAVTFTATTTNYPSAATFTWDYGDTAGPPAPPPPGPPPPGGCPPNLGCIGAPPQSDEVVSVDAAQATDAVAETNAGSYTYVNIGTHTVTVTASAGTVSITKTWQIAITQGGPPPPSNVVAVTGATINPFNGQYEVSAGVTVTFAAAEAHAASWAWDFGDGDTGSGQTATHAFRAAGVETVTLTVTGDGTTNQGTNTTQIRFNVSPPSFQALMIPGAGSILADSGNWATDLSVTNPGTQPVTITLYFAAFSDDIPTDLSTLPFDSTKSVSLSAGQSWSGIDIVGDASILNRPGAGKGILLLKFEGGNATPIVTSRVYFTAQGSSFGTALPSFVVGPYGATQAQAAEAATGQMLIGLRNDSLYRFNVSLFNSSSDGGLFHVDAFSEDGVQVAARDFAVPAYSQAGVNDSDIIGTLDPTKRYILKATSTTGGLQAYASSLDRRNNDLVQVSDDTPRFNVPPDTPVSYYMPGVGRIEDEASNAHWRTDLRVYNPSTLPRTVFLEYHYTPTGAPAEAIVTKPLSIGAKQGISIDDVVGNFLDDATDADLKAGTVLGMLKVTYNAPPDVATAPLIIGGRIYADLSTGTAGMQLSVFTDSQSVAPGNSRLIMPGAQTNLRFRTNIGLFALGTLPTTVRIHAIKQDGTETSSYDFTLNDGGHGAFAQIPMTALPTIDGNPMTIRVEALNGSRIGAYIVTVDQISADTVFIQGKPIS